MGEEGIDYAEKLIEDEIADFSLLIRFPPRLQMDGAPYFEVFQVTAEGDEIRNDDLTSSLDSCFYYSSLLRTAVLRIKDPPRSNLYRISWRLGAPAPPLQTESPVSVLRQRQFAKKLLEIRNLQVSGKKGTPEQEEFLTAIFTALATFAQDLTHMVDERSTGTGLLDGGSLDLTLMVLDNFAVDQVPRLRIVAATEIKDPEYRDFTLGVGDETPDVPLRKRWPASTTAPAPNTIPKTTLIWTSRAVPVTHFSSPCR